jgi:predicted DsbA family dithiol-disulfide isomerase
MKQLSIDIWSDIACPWCYVGKRRLEKALEEFEHKDSVAINWHSFELNPSAPRAIDEGPHAERLAKKYGMSLSQAEARIAHLRDVAKADGLDFDFEHIRPGNTFDAHRVVHLGAEQGLQGAVKERLLRGYLSEGEAIGEPDVLVRLAAEAGLDAEQVSATLASNAYADEVRADERQAAQLGINGVPFFVLGGRYAVSGAQPAEVLVRALRQAYTELVQPFELVSNGAAADGEACGPDGCEVPARPSESRTV